MRLGERGACKGGPAQQQQPCMLDSFDHSKCLPVEHHANLCCPFTAVRYFYATIGLGTPTRTFDLIIDTGSTISYVPCKDCRHCGKHKAGGRLGP